MPKTKVLFIWDVEEPLKEYLVRGLAPVAGNIELAFPCEADSALLLEQAAAADVIVGWRPTEGMLENAARLRLWIHPGVGVRHLIPPITELSERRSAAGMVAVQLANGHGNTYMTAQHAVALLLALTNRIVPHHNWMAAGRWRMGDDEAKSIPLRGRRVGLLGYGAIGSKIQRFLGGFDLNFNALRRDWSKATPDTPPDLRRYGEDELSDFLTSIDILFVALPHTERTEGLLGAGELGLLGADSLLVNVARGKIIEETALYSALKEGSIAGAALDVWYDYRPEPDSAGRAYPYSLPFHELPNVILSPHRAASPFDDLPRWDEVIDNITRVAEGRADLLNIVDLKEGY